jgi:hypothetical protein
MNWVPKQLGAEPKKVVALGGLALVLLYFMWSNLFSGGGSSQPSPTQSHAVTPSASVAPAPTAALAPQRRPIVHKSAQSENLEDFKPSMKRARQIATDPTKVDPTLRLDLLAQLQRAKFEGNMRSLFEFSQAPPPPLTAKDPGRIIPGALRAGVPFGPQPLQPPPKPPPPPPPPPIPLKFYGFVNPARPDIKSAFFLDGEEILVASEGQTIRNRYRIVHIGVNSAVVEDTQYKNQQTLKLVAEDQG